MKLYLRNPQIIAIMFVVPAVLVMVLSRALGAFYGRPDAYQQTVPGFTFMFAFFGMTQSAEALFRERAHGNWPRLLSLPVPRSHLMLGKAIAPMIMVTTQIVVLLLTGVAVFGIHLGALLPLAILIVTTAF